MNWVIITMNRFERQVIWLFYLVDLWFIDDALGSLSISQSTNGLTVVQIGWGDG